MPLVSRIVAAVAALAIVSGCASGARSLPPLSAPDVVRAAVPAGGVTRGKVEKLWFVGVFDVKRMKQGLYGKVIDTVGGPPQCPVRLYGLIYDTIGVKGEAATASAGMFVPGEGCRGPFALVGYSHGTNVVKMQQISDPKTTSKTGTAPDQDPVVVASIYGAHGYVAVATDYLGLGLSNYSYHPYLVGAAEASAVIDSMRAARLAAATLKIKLNGKVFLSGHSQGGQSTVATQKAIEAMGGKEFDLVASAPSSGPYNLTQTFIDSLHHQSQDAPILAAFILPGYNKTYGNVYTNATDIFREPYATGIDSLLPVPTFYDSNAWLYGKKLPLKTRDLLKASFYTSFWTDPNSGARVDTAKNDLLAGWTPKAPIDLCGGSRDPEVEYRNAIAAYRAYHKEGVNVTITNVDGIIPSYIPITDYHVVVALFCLPLMRAEFFDGYRN